MSIDSSSAGRHGHRRRRPCGLPLLKPRKTHGQLDAHHHWTHVARRGRGSILGRRSIEVVGLIVRLWRQGIRLISLVRGSGGQPTSRRLVAGEVVTISLRYS